MSTVMKSQNFTTATANSTDGNTSPTHHKRGPSSTGSTHGSSASASNRSSLSGSPVHRAVPSIGSGESDLQLIELIGQGGNGDVYSGVAPDGEGVKSTVAVKIISSKTFSSSSCKEKAFKNAMSRLLSSDHPNILRLDSIYDCGGKTAVVSELCRGTDVVKLIQTHEPGTVDPNLCRRIFRDIIQGLAYLHSTKVVHCDIKLDNVKFRDACMETSDSVILDLDSCLIEEDVQLVKEESNRIARGTFQYMPPEAFRGHYSYAGDIWSAGVTLFCLIDGHFPFKIRQGAHVDELVLAVSMPPRFKPHIWSRLPGAEATVRAMLNVNPAKRPQAADILNHSWIGPTSHVSCASRQSAPVSFQRQVDPTARPASYSASVKSPSNLTKGASWDSRNAHSPAREQVNSLASAVHGADAVPAATPGSPVKRQANTSSSNTSSSLKSPSSARRQLGNLSLLFRGHRSNKKDGEESSPAASRGTNRPWGRLPNLLSPQNSTPSQRKPAFSK